MSTQSKNAIKYNQIISLIAEYGKDDVETLVKAIFERKLLTVSELAKILSCSRQQIYNILGRKHDSK